MKIRLLAFFGALAVLAAGVAAVTGSLSGRSRGGVPDLVFEHAVHDFGRMEQKTEASVEFPFRNRGTGVLRIEETTSTCECITTAALPREVAPGEGGVLRVRFNSGTFTTPVTRTVTVVTNAPPPRKRAEVQVRATVVPAVRFDPPVASLDVPAGQEGRQEVRVQRPGGKPLRIRRVKSENGLVRAEWAPDAKDPSAAVITLTAPPSEPRWFSDTVLVEMEAEGRTREASLSVTGRVLDGVRVVPSVITLRPASPGGPVSRTALITQFGPGPLRIEEVASRLGRVSGKIETLAEGREFRLEVRLAEGAPPEGEDHVVLPTNNAKDPLVLVLVKWKK